MAKKLRDFLKAEFSQGTRLRSEFRYKKEAQPGVCLSLVVSWVRVAAAIDSLEGWADAVASDFNISIVRQSIFDDSATGPGEASLADKWSIADKWNAVSSVTGLKFHPEIQGTSTDPFAVAFGIDKLPDGFHLLRIQFSGGESHAIGLHTNKNKLINHFFDPNFGIFEVGDFDLPDFAEELWTQYRVDQKTINDWRFYQILKAQTARERMVAALGNPP
jgi:hypothetical protein